MFIPRTIYQTYFTRDLPFITRFFIWRMKQMNKNYRYEFYDDDRIELFFKQECDQEIYHAYRKISIGAAKADFFRYNILYKKGGIYLDIDSTVAKPLDKLIRKDDHAIISKEGNPNMYVQWGLIYESGHPFLHRTISKIVDNIKHNKYPHDVHQMTGPSVYSEAIRECLNENRNIPYREFGVDYNGFLKFKHPLNKFLYRNREHWKKTQLKTTVIKTDDTLA